RRTACSTRRAAGWWAPRTTSPSHSRRTSCCRRCNSTVVRLEVVARREHVPGARCGAREAPAAARLRTTSMPIQKILLVDDSKTELHHLSELLGKSGFSVRTAENGEDAMKRLREGRARPIPH